METFLEIVKTTVPALVVFLTVYFLFKNFFEGQVTLEQIKRSNKKTKEALPLKLQAYERLMLYCERIKIANLSLRLNIKDGQASDLANAMMVAIHKEYEHNLAQQIYVSNQLWQIINMAKNQTIGIISEAKDRLTAGAPASKLLEECGEILSGLKVDPLEQAKSAIKEEVSVILN
jgi:hypothetical protein